MNKETKTLNALCNVLGCRQEEITGDLPSLGESGEVSIFIDDWVASGDGYQVVSEAIYLDFERLPSGRIGRWTMTSIDTDEQSDTFKDREIRTGKGQWN
jgi:hypothetical protein